MNKFPKMFNKTLYQKYQCRECGAITLGEKKPDPKLACKWCTSEFLVKSKNRLYAGGIRKQEYQCQVCGRHTVGEKLETIAFGNDTNLLRC